MSSVSSDPTKRPPRLLAEAEAGDDGSVALHVGLVEVGKLSSTLPNHHEKTAPRVMILAVNAQMLRQVINTLRKHRDLDLGGAGVSLVLCVVFDDFGFSLGCERHSALQALVILLKSTYSE